MRAGVGKAAVGWEEGGSVAAAMGRGEEDGVAVAEEKAMEVAGCRQAVKQSVS